MWNYYCCILPSAVSLCFLLHHEEGLKWTEAQGSREERDNPERKGRSREGQGVCGPGRAAMGKEGGTQVAPSPRAGPGEVPAPEWSLRQPHHSVAQTTLLDLPGLLWLIPGFGKGMDSGELMPGATVVQRHWNFLQTVHYLEFKKKIIFFLNHRKNQWGFSLAHGLM